MKIEGGDLLAEFYETLKKEYGEDFTLGVQDVKDIITAPFGMLKKVISSGLLTPVRFTGFALFFVYPKKIKAELKSLQERHKKGNLSQNSYEKYSSAFETFLEAYEKDK